MIIARVLGVVAAIGAFASAAATQQAPSGAAPFDFQGRALVSISDADMVASAYVDGRLGPREGRDAIGVIDLAGGHPRDFSAAEVEASNSVAGPPVAVAATPESVAAELTPIVNESDGRRPERTRFGGRGQAEINRLTAEARNGFVASGPFAEWLRVE